MNTEEKLLKFRNLLYPNNEEAEELDEHQVKKVIFECLREVLKMKQYQFTIGSYYFDITPRHLSVIYETPDTRMEISNKIIHFETTRQTPVRFFVISDKEQDEYPDDSPYIVVSGDILHYDNMVTDETYSFTLVNDDENDAIKNYIKVPVDTMVTEDDYLNDNKTIALNRVINIKDKRTDVSIFFNTPKVRSVEYDYKNKTYLPFKFVADKDYTELVPDLTKKKRIIGTIYSTIVDFYNEYLNK